jgi:hypothetical protein
VCSSGGRLARREAGGQYGADRRSGSGKREQTVVVVTSDMTASVAASTDIENIQAYCQLKKKKRLGER